MLNILVFDNKFSVESLSAISSKYTTIKFFRYNDQYSFFDNFDLVKPNLILINKNFYNIDSDKDIKCKIINYENNNIIANELVVPNLHSKSYQPILIIDNVNILSKKDILYNNRYVKIYSLSTQYNYVHQQYLGYIDSCEALHNLINNHDIVLTDTSIISDICQYTQTRYGIYKNHGTIQLKNNNIKPITNIDFYEKHISNILR